MKVIISKIQNTLLEAEDQQDSPKTLWEHDLREELTTRGWKKIWYIRILKFMSVKIKEFLIDQFRYGI